MCPNHYSVFLLFIPLSVTVMNNLGSISWFQIIDNAVTEFYGISQKEFDIILDNATDKEIDILADGCLAENEEVKNKGFEVVNKYIKI
jgi:hypothetical protein